MTFGEIAEDLLVMMRDDQEMRKRVINGGDFDSSLDVGHTNRLKKIVEDIGWPTISKVGEEASHAAWLLVQHADIDVDFQKLCLEMMRDVSSGEIQVIELAFLEDRVRVNEERDQLFGTQFYLDDATGLFGPRSIENIDGLDDRRAQFGLGPFADYRDSMIAKYGS